MYALPESHPDSVYTVSLTGGSANTVTFWTHRTRKVFSLTTCIVSFDGLRLNDDGGVASLVVLALVGNGAGDITGGESEARRDGGEK